jgi:hypothetical protein
MVAVAEGGTAPALAGAVTVSPPLRQGCPDGGGAWPRAPIEHLGEHPPPLFAPVGVV